jgi:hypothetical protein
MKVSGCISALQIVGRIPLIGHFVFALEALYSTCRINDSLLTREERMAFTAKLDFQYFFGRASGKCVTA